MKFDAKRAIEIAGGIIVGVLASEMVDKVVNVAKKQVLKHKEKVA